MIAKDGAEKAEEFLTGIRANLARTAGGGDRDVARDILADICDVGIANSYYVGLMRSGAGGPEQQEWGNAIKVDPADLRRRRRHARQHQRRGGRQERAEQGERGQAARIPGVAGGAGDLRQGQLRVSGAGRRRGRSDHRRARRAEIRSAAASRDRRPPARRRASSSTRSASTRRCDGVRGHDLRRMTIAVNDGRAGRRMRPARSDSWWLAASALIVALALAAARRHRLFRRCAARAMSGRT